MAKFEITEELLSQIENLQMLLRDVDVAGRGFNQNVHSHWNALLFFCGANRFFVYYCTPYRPTMQEGSGEK